MSAIISPSSPRFEPSSGDLFVFDGAEELAQAWRDGLLPDPALTVSEWADQHRVLSPRASAEPGRYRTDRTPYMREIVDALSPMYPVRRIVVMKSAQVGFTEGGNNWIGYVIHHAPGPMLAVQPTVELAKRFSRQRIEPLIAESPALRERVKPARSRDAGNTVLSKEFPAGLLVITGANSAVGLRSMPARYLFLDEVDAYPPSADEEGDPVALAEARTRTFSWRSKILLGSTPTIHGLSRIEREYEATDQRRYFVPCPHCGEMQWLKFERLRWDKGKPETAHYECVSCDGRIAPIKGVEGFNRAAPVIGPTHVDVTEGGKKLRRGARLWTIAVATFKSETYRFLRLATPTDEEFAAGARFPTGYIHLPRGVEAEWVKQLVAEQLVTVKTKRGFTRLEWQKLRERNEALDCRVYARAAAWIAGADRWTEAMWRDLESQIGASEPMDNGPSAEPNTPLANIAGLIRRLPKRRSRPVFRSSYMSR
jgi:phage terminase large subunit GpA-like protein